MIYTFHQRLLTTVLLKTAHIKSTLDVPHSADVLSSSTVIVSYLSTRRPSLDDGLLVYSELCLLSLPERGVNGSY